MPRPDLHDVLPDLPKPRGVLVFLNPQARKWALIGITVALLGLVGAVVAERADASVKPATTESTSVKPATMPSDRFKSYPVPRQCKGRQCKYVADDRCEIEDPDYPLNGVTIDAYRMLVGYPEFVINKRGQFHVDSFEYLGYNELGEHHFDRVGVHVRIPGTKLHRSQRVTPIYWFLPGGVKNGKALTEEENGWTVRGLVVVFDAYDRGNHCRVVVSPWDVAWATGGVR
jgi:hypothetical protein